MIPSTALKRALNVTSATEPVYLVYDNVRVGVFLDYDFEARSRVCRLSCQTPNQWLAVSEKVASVEDAKAKVGDMWDRLSAAIAPEVCE